MTNANAPRSGRTNDDVNKYPTGTNSTAPKVNTMAGTNKLPRCKRSMIHDSERPPTMLPPNTIAVLRCAELLGQPEWVSSAGSQFDSR